MEMEKWSGCNSFVQSFQWLLQRGLSDGERRARPSPLYDTHPSTVVTGAHHSDGQQRHVHWFEMCTHHNKRSWRISVCVRVYVCVCLCVCVCVCVCFITETSMVWSTQPLSYHQRTQVRAALWVLRSHVTLSTQGAHIKDGSLEGTKYLHTHKIIKNARMYCTRIRYSHTNTQVHSKGIQPNLCVHVCAICINQPLLFWSTAPL